MVRRPQIDADDRHHDQEREVAEKGSPRPLTERGGPRQGDAVVERNELDDGPQVSGVRRQGVEGRREEEHRHEGEAVDGHERAVRLHRRGVGDERCREGQRDESADEGQRQTTTRTAARRSTR